MKLLNQNTFVFDISHVTMSKMWTAVLPVRLFAGIDL